MPKADSRFPKSQQPKAVFPIAETHIPKTNCTPMTPEDIQHIIAQGENSSVEFKSADVRTESFARECVAFSNMSGGTILIGIEDDGTVTGLQSNRNYEEWIANVARNNLTPPVNLVYTEIIIQKKKVGLVHVPKGKDKPYQDVSGKFYVRVGSTNRIASLNELMRLFQQGGLFHYDLTGILGTSIAHLNSSKLDDYFNRYGVDFLNEQEEERTRLLENTDILTADGEVTIAGMLIFGLHPQRYLPNASISFACYQGADIAEELHDKQVIEGTLDIQIDTTFAVLRNHVQKASTIQGAKRVETEGYPDVVYRELIVNACIHRNYSITGSRIRIFLFSDRIEFMSPGRLPNTITIDKLKAGVSYSINPVLLKFMENLRYIDKLGRGLPMVYQAARKLNREVQFEEVGDEFKVTLYL